MSSLPKIARFAVLDDERGLILGQDLGNIFEKGIVYEAINVMGEIILKPVGKYALPLKGHPSIYSDVNTQVNYGIHLITKEEQEKYIKTLRQDDWT